MKCPRCQHGNEAGAKFCEECAAPLARTCTHCGRQLYPTAKFCPECARPTGLTPTSSTAQRFGSPETYTPKHLAEKILTSRAALEGERKQVTVLFADLKGSMELLADRDPEEARVAHCHPSLGKLSRRTGKREQAREHLTTATTLYRDMDMRFWLEQAQAESMELGA